MGWDSDDRLQCDGPYENGVFLHQCPHKTISRFPHETREEQQRVFADSCKVWFLRRNLYNPCLCPYHQVKACTGVHRESRKVILESTNHWFGDGPKLKDLWAAPRLSSRPSVPQQRASAQSRNPSQQPMGPTKAQEMAAAYSGSVDSPTRDLSPDPSEDLHLTAGSDLSTDDQQARAWTLAQAQKSIDNESNEKGTALLSNAHTATQSYPSGSVTPRDTATPKDVTMTPRESGLDRSLTPSSRTKDKNRQERSVTPSNSDRWLDRSANTGRPKVTPSSASSQPRSQSKVTATTSLAAPPRASPAAEANSSKKNDFNDRGLRESINELRQDDLDELLFAAGQTEGESEQRRLRQLSSCSELMSILGDALGSVPPSTVRRLLAWKLADPAPILRVPSAPTERTVSAAPSDPSEVFIAVKWVTGEAVLTTRLRVDSTIADVKREVNRSTGVNIQDQVILAGNVMLSNSQLLSEGVASSSSGEVDLKLAVKLGPSERELLKIRAEMSDAPEALNTLTLRDMWGLKALMLERPRLLASHGIMEAFCHILAGIDPAIHVDKHGAAKDPEALRDLLNDPRRLILSVQKVPSFIHAGKVLHGNVLAARAALRAHQQFDAKMLKVKLGTLEKQSKALYLCAMWTISVIDYYDSHAEVQEHFGGNPAPGW